MKPSSFLVLSLTLMAGPLAAQTTHNFEVGGGGLFPVSGYLAADNYLAGPAWRGGYEFRPIRFLGLEAGYTQAGLPTSNCNRFGCVYPRETLSLLDYGVRGVAPLAGGRVELSLGLGGGHVWHPYGDKFTNASLFQYSGKAAAALDKRHHFRVAATVRTWRDLGRPTQQWLSVTGSLIFGL